MRFCIILVFILFCFCTVTSQSWPSVFVEDYDIQNVVLQGDKTYFATDKHIVQVDSLDIETVLVETSGSTQDGRFWKQSNGWVYIGWQYVDGDVLRPIIVLRIWDGDFLVNKKIDLYDFDSITNIGVSYQSSDSIYVLAEGFSQRNILRINLGGEVLETNSFDINGLVDMKLLENGINLVIGGYRLYKIKGNSVVNQTAFDEKILDVKVYRAEERIEVLTSSKLHVFDYGFVETDFISLPQNGREAVACFTYQSTTYLIETAGNQSYISTVDSSGNILAEYLEEPDIKYNDLYISNNIYNVWGGNSCVLGGGLLKADTAKFESDILYIDLSIVDFTLVFDSIYLEYLYYSWELVVTDNSDDTVENYRVGSYNYTFNIPPYISFTSEDQIEAGESRIHTGDFKVPNFQNTLPGFGVWLGLDRLDANCSDNFTSVSFPTSSYEVNIPEIVIYPNPTSDILTVDVPNVYSYRIFDVNGNLIDSQKDYKIKNIDVSELKPKLYLIEILVEGHRMMNKFMKI